MSMNRVLYNIYNNIYNIEYLYLSCTYDETGGILGWTLFSVCVVGFVVNVIFRFHLFCVTSVLPVLF